MHVHQPAAREDAQPDQEDVLDPEAREPALPGGGGAVGWHVREAPCSGGVTPGLPVSPARRPELPPPRNTAGSPPVPSALTAPMLAGWGTGAQALKYTGGQSQLQNGVAQGGQLYTELTEDTFYESPSGLPLI